MPIDYVQLKSELNTDPAALGYAPYLTIGNDSALMGLLNQPSGVFQKYAPFVDINTVLTWAAPAVLGSIQQTSVSSSGMLQSVCLAALKMFGTSPTLNLENSSINSPSGMIQYLESQGIISPADVASLLACSGVSPASRAEALFGDGTTIQLSDISFALRGQR